MKKYKILFLDWNGTLSTSKFWGHLEKSTEDDKRLFEKIDKTLFGELRHLIKPWMRGEIKSEDVVKEVSDKSGIRYQRVLKQFIVGCKKMEYVDNKCVDLINKIRGNGVRVVIATDNMDSFVRWTVPSLGLNLVFDGILDSYTLKAMKNDFSEAGISLFFDSFIKSNGIGKGESVLIDDSEDKEGKIQSCCGIDYLKIEAGIGLMPALKRILRETSARTSK